MPLVLDSIQNHALKLSYELTHEIMALFVLRKFILQTHMRNQPVELCLIFGGTLRLLPYFMCANSEGSGETARMRRLAWAFAGCLCDKYHNLMSWLKWFIICFNSEPVSEVLSNTKLKMSQLMRLWYLSHRRPAKAQASLRSCSVSPEPSLFPHMKYGSRRRVQPKSRHLATLDGCTCAFEKWVYRGWKVP